MNLRVYLCFLRPLRSLALVGMYSLIAWAWGGGLVHPLDDTAMNIALTVVTPLLLGLFIAGAAHEPMHRPFALLLPNIRRRQRTAAGVSLILAALMMTCVARWVAPAISPVATFGLTSALIALPCLDRHQMLGGAAGGWGAFLGWLLICFFVGSKLVLVMNAVPWLFLIGGLTVSAASLAQGFSRQSLRARVNRLFIAHQTHLFSYASDLVMTAHWREEVAADKNRRAKEPARSGRDWGVRTVGAAPLDWIRVLWHASSGRQKRRSFLNFQLRFAALVPFSFALLPLIQHFAGRNANWEHLVQLAAPDMALFTMSTGALSLWILLLQPGMAVYYSFLLVTPQLAYPISRERLARVVFWQTFFQWTAALVVPAPTIFLASLVGQVMSGKFLPGYGLPVLLAFDLPLAALLPLMLAAGAIQRTNLRNLVTLPILFALLALAFTRFWWSHSVLSLPGVLGLLMATLASQWLLWRGLRRYYTTTDLVLKSSFVNPLAIDSVSPR